MWNEKKSPKRLEKRFEFDNYQLTSKFMKEIETLCKEYEIYPNISFGGKFVSITTFFESAKRSDEEINFTNEIDKKYQYIIK